MAATPSISGESRFRQAEGAVRATFFRGFEGLRRLFTYFLAGQRRKRMKTPR